MKPASGNSLVDRIMQWLRGMWASSADRLQARKEGAGTTDEAATEPAERIAGAQGDDVAANGAPEAGAATSTGASQDEFATGGYTPDNPDLEAVETAAGGTDTVTGDPSNGDQGADTLVDQEMSIPVPPSGNYGVGNLGLGSRGSLGAPPQSATATEPDSSDDGRTITDQETIDVADATVPDDTESRQPGVVEAGDTSEPIPDTGANVADPDVPASAGENVRGISEAGDDELGRLDELDQGAIAFESDADEQFDANSQPGFAADVPGSLAEIDYETEDYSSSALQDAGLRIVDDDEAGISMREPGADEFVDPGSVIDEPARNTGDARPLGDFTQARSGIASESDEPTGTAGDRSTEPFGSETGMNTAETWNDEDSTEGLGAVGELAATDFGSTVDGDESEGLVDASDIDVADLSYLDDADRARFDVLETPPGVVGAGDLPASAGAVDDIGASPTGVRDTGGVVESDLEEPSESAPSSTSDPVEITGTGEDVVDGIADSPTGVVDAAASIRAREDEVSDMVREHVPLTSAAAATSTASARPAATGPGGSVRGDGTGACPDDYPIKGNGSSKIYHLPDAASYAGTKAEWCFATEDQAQAAGYRPPGQRNRGGSPGASAGRGSGRRSSGGRNR